MLYDGLIITGTRGSGKSSLVRKLSSESDCWEQVQAVTTRKKRADDGDGEYEYISEEEMADLIDDGQLLVTTEYGGRQYGIRNTDLRQVKDRCRIPILIVSPDTLESFSNSEWLTIFVDAHDHVLDRRLRVRDQRNCEDTNDQRDRDRVFRSRALYVLENRTLEKSAELVRALWNYKESSGVLSKRIVKLMICCGMLLEDAKNGSVKGASYDLLLGDEYFYGGRIRYLDHRNPILVVEPYDYAIVTSHERAVLPRDICGRFDLSVSLFCQGIILSNGPQVDPGFSGPLFCLLFNTSSSPVFLRRRQHYCTIEFHKLIEPTDPYEGRYLGKTLLEYLPTNAARGAINELKKELERVRRQGERVQNLSLAMLSIVLALIAVWIAFQ